MFKKHKNKLFVVVLLVVAGGVFFYMKKKKAVTQKKESIKEQPQEPVEAIEPIPEPIGGQEVTVAVKDKTLVEAAPKTSKQ